MTLPLDPPLTRGAAPGWISQTRMFSDLELEELDRDPEDPARQAEFARKLIDRDPENLWAMAILANDVATDFERLVILREAVRVGLRLWAPVLERGAPPPDWNTDTGGRLFMGVVQAYGLALTEAGHRPEAAECLAFLLKLDPADRRGATEAFQRVGLVSSGPLRRV